MATETRPTTAARRLAKDSRARREFIARSFDRAAQSDVEALESARAMATNMRSGKPLQRAPAR